MHFSTQYSKNTLRGVMATSIIWFLFLGYRDLIGSEEGRYAEIAREMLASGDWITPRLNGYKYFEKPPLHYWGSALSMALFEVNNISARIWCVALGFFGALWTGYVGRRLYGQPAGYYAFLMLISSLMYVMLGHTNSLDMGVSVFLALAIGALVLAQSQRNNTIKARNLMLLAWAAAAGATLTKGLIGIVLPGGGLFIYLLWQRDWQLLRCLHFRVGLPLFLILTAPWFISVSVENPEFPHFFFIHEHFERFVATGHHRNKPIWYFMVILFAGSLPWIGTIGRALFKPSFTWKANAGQFEASRLLWSYAVFIFVFFSLSSSKLLPYILPMYPALALLAGEKASYRPAFAFDGMVAAVLAVILLFFSWNIEVLAKISKSQAEVLLIYRPWIVSAAVVLICGSIGVLMRQKKQAVAMTVLAVCSLIAFQMIAWGFQTESRNMSNRIMAEAIRPHLGPNTKIYTVKRYDRPLSFYLGRTLTLVEYKDELDFGIAVEPLNFIASVDAFLPIWINSSEAIAELGNATYQQWLRKKVPMHVIYQDWNRTVVVRRRKDNLELNEFAKHGYKTKHR